MTIMHLEFKTTVFWNLHIKYTPINELRDLDWIHKTVGLLLKFVSQNGSCSLWTEDKLAILFVS